ncbi:MAG TPA: DUF2059 domain-containing protein [Gammaproteobacteria bacterium]|jgi:hypothetical protein
MKAIFAGIILAVSSTAAVAASAQDAAAPTTAPAAASAASAAPVISQQFHDEIITLLHLAFTPRMADMTHAICKIYVSNLQAKYRSISPAVADEIAQDVAQAMNQPDRVNQLEEDMVPVYAASYTEAEILQLIAFGKTPAGAKMFAGAPNEKQIAAAMQPWAIGVLAPVMLMDTARILKAHGIEMNQQTP